VGQATGPCLSLNETFCPAGVPVRKQSVGGPQIGEGAQHSHRNGGWEGEGVIGSKRGSLLGLSMRTKRTGVVPPSSAPGGVTTAAWNGRGANEGREE